jgi:hypothetical protein
MSIQNTNNWSGNSASRRANPEFWAKRETMKRAANSRTWAMQAQIANEINPKICREDLEARLSDLGITQDPERPARQANRRKTDSKGLRGGGGDATFFHPELGKPEAGVRMVSILKRDEEAEETQNVEIGVEEATPVNNNLEVNP